MNKSQLGTEWTGSLQSGRFVHKFSGSQKQEPSPHSANSDIQLVGFAHVSGISRMPMWDEVMWYGVSQGIRDQEAMCCCRRWSAGMVSLPMDLWVEFLMPLPHATGDRPFWCQLVPWQVGAGEFADQQITNDSSFSVSGSGYLSHDDPLMFTYERHMFMLTLVCPWVQAIYYFILPCMLLLLYCHIGKMKKTSKERPFLGQHHATNFLFPIWKHTE